MKLNQALVVFVCIISHFWVVGAMEGASRGKALQPSDQTPKLAETIECVTDPKKLNDEVFEIVFSTFAEWLSSHETLHATSSLPRAAACKKGKKIASRKKSIKALLAEKKAQKQKEEDAQEQEEIIQDMLDDKKLEKYAVASTYAWQNISGCSRMHGENISHLCKKEDASTAELSDDLIKKRFQAHEEVGCKGIVLTKEMFSATGLNDALLEEIQPVCPFKYLKRIGPVNRY